MINISSRTLILRSVELLPGGSIYLNFQQTFGSLGVSTMLPDNISKCHIFLNFTMDISKIILDKFLLFGDSITEFGSSLPHGILLPELTELYIRKLDIVIRGFAGYNSDEAKLILPEILKSENNNEGTSKIKLMTMFFGTNDAAGEIQDVPIDRYEKNMRDLVELILKRDISLILITPAIHGQKLWASRVKPGVEGRSNPKSKRYAEIVKKIGIEFNVPVVDLFTLFSNYLGYSLEEKKIDEIDEDIPGTEKLLVDGIHFSKQGYTILLNGILDAIEKNYPQFMPSKMNRVLSYWRDIDTNNLEGTMFIPGPP